MPSTAAAASIRAGAGHKTKWLFLTLWLIRIINALTLKTFFQPDEYFQALEPAWRSTFGPASNAWITWEWHENLRSSIHPLLFAICYKGAGSFGHWLKASPRIRAEILIAAPKVLQAGFAAATDLFTYRLACQLYGWGTRTSLVALALSVLSPWNWFASTRTFSNSLETTLTITALQCWPWESFIEIISESAKSNGNGTKSDKDTRLKPEEDQTSAPEDLTTSLMAAALACMLRPTNLLVWLTVTISHILHGLSKAKILELAQAAVFCGGTVLAVSVAMDRHFYRDWVFPPLKFLHFNVVRSMAVFYGRNRLDYYFTEGLPLLLTTALPCALFGGWQIVLSSFKRQPGWDSKESKTREILLSIVVTSVSTLTMLSHKEVRFIFPLLPILHIIAARPATVFFWPAASSARKVRLVLLAVVILANIVIAGYASYYHQRGVVDVMHHLRHEYEAKYMTSNTTPEMTVGFLMPCHSTPWRSHLVYPEISAWALTCEPPLHLGLEEREGYLDEADMFYADPNIWLEENMEVGRSDKDAMLEPTRRYWPRYLVFFEQLKPVMELQSIRTKYEECWRGFNTHWHDDWRRQGDVVVWCTR